MDFIVYGGLLLGSIIMGVGVYYRSIGMDYENFAEMCQRPEIREVNPKAMDMFTVRYKRFAKEPFRKSWWCLGFAFGILCCLWLLLLLVR